MSGFEIIAWAMALGKFVLPQANGPYHSHFGRLSEYALSWHCAEVPVIVIMVESAAPQDLGVPPKHKHSWHQTMRNFEVRWHLVAIRCWGSL